MVGRRASQLQFAPLAPRSRKGTRADPHAISEEAIGKRYVQRPAPVSSRSPTPIPCFLHWLRRRSTRLTKRGRLDFPLCAEGMRRSENSRDVGASSLTTFELATLAHRLHLELMKAEPKRRGRGFDE